MIRAQVIVRPRASIFDPQGDAVCRAIQHLGVSAVKQAHVGKCIELEIEGDDVDRRARAARDDLPGPALQPGDRGLRARPSSRAPRNNHALGVIQFPGSNCDQDAFHVLKNVLGQEAEYVWHKETSLGGADAVVVPGGFSYGDYLRCGAIARFSPIMGAVKEAAARQTVLGICNGFQILCEAGLLPGVLVRNASLHFRCETMHVRVENADTRFTSGIKAGQVLRIPIAHGEGNYVADDATLDSLFANKQVLFTYSDAQGRDDAGESQRLAAQHRRHHATAPAMSSASCRTRSARRKKSSAATTAWGFSIRFWRA